jgi:hypothetical protein
MEMAVAFSMLGGRSVVLNVRFGTRVVDVKPELCKAFVVLPNLCLEILDDEGCAYQEPSMPFWEDGGSYNVVFVWRSLYNPTLRNLPRLKNEAAHAGTSNTPETALAGGAYTSPNMLGKWGRGGLSLSETTHYVRQACRADIRAGMWAAALCRTSRMSSSRITVDNVHTLDAIVRDRPGDLGPYAEAAVKALATYLRTHDIGTNPKRRLRRKTKPVTLKARLANHNARTMR